MTRPIDLSKRPKMYELHESRRSRSLANLSLIDYIPPSDLEKELKKTEKNWNRLNGEAKKSTIVALIRNASSFSDVGRINALKKIIELKQVKDKKKRHVMEKTYVSETNMDELGELSIYLESVLPNYIR